MGEGGSDHRLTRRSGGRAFGRGSGRRAAGAPERGSAEARKRGSAEARKIIPRNDSTRERRPQGRRSQRTLEKIYAPQYETAVKQGGAGAVMCSYNRINSVYACENPSTLGILDDQFGFTGFVVSDWGGTHSTVASAKAGLDMEMDTARGTYYGSALQTAVQDGQVPMATLDDMVLRILRPMFRIGLFDHPVAAQPGAFGAKVSTAAHVALARTVSEAGTVLLKNQDGLLPITGSGKTIAVIGQPAGPVLMPWQSSIKGLFEAWYPGQEDGNAIAALFGDVDPSRD